MAITTNVPKVTFGPNGFIAPSQQAVLDGVQADQNEAFGGNLNPSLSTPQGQVASSTTAIIGQANDTFLYQSTQTDPAYAEGRWQDAIARIYFIERNPAEPTVVQAKCTGGAGVVIPVGALAKSADGNIYTCTEAGVIAGTGFITLPFACNIPGPITCPAGSLNQIYQAINGWDSVTNEADGVIGNNVESRADFEARRAASVALNSRGSLPSVLGAVLDISGVLDAYVTENVVASPVVIGGATVAGKSIYVSVVGGDLDEVAKAIWSKKAPGCGYNGNTTRTVYDDNSGYTAPYPSYQVTFEVPPGLPIMFAVNILNSALVPSDAVLLIQNAIIAAFAGADGGPRARIGSTILATRFITPIAALGWAQIISLQIGSRNTSAARFSGTIAGTTLTVGAVITGTIAIGQTISDTAGVILPGTIITAGAGTSWTISKTQTVAGASFTGTASGANLTASAVTGTIDIGDIIAGTGVPAGTTIVSQTSGTPGGAGVYVTSVATTASAAALTSKADIGGALANQNSVSVNINQVPTISADNIAVTIT